MKNSFIVLRLTSTNSKHFEESYNIYLKSFPECERRPLEDHEKILKDPRFHWVVFIRNSKAIGLFAYWELDTVIHLEHFCVCPSARGSGLGTEILNRMKTIFRRYPKPVLLEIEPPSSSELALRRKGFYGRHGFVYHDNIDYWKQPSYDRNDVYAVPLHVMTLDKALDDKEWDIISKDILSSVYFATQEEIDEMPVVE